jgi:hypothetical protein
MRRVAASRGRSGSTIDKSVDSPGFNATLQQPIGVVSG